MSTTRPRRRSPSPTFIGALIGVGCALVVPPRMMLTAEGTIAWLLAWSGTGLVAGAVVEAVASRVRGRDAA
ncbi:hypothetical protein OJF2_34570 [Aquisphaera giovannonii]|uniref:Uncharacterized protein n=1 Tax=Aquisphaera giovannonii TaxID=406548 RepID=A0A5B9W2U8_9BACT|nr:hypothetical protein [Aquisphaera giovannonii]QEH34912.1 hypothetical protein OJF2_34570 [Aquisphaera giovannonii]